MKIILAADHGGFEMKEKIKQWLVSQEVEVVDIGADRYDKVDDFVDYVVKAMNTVDFARGDRVIMMCRNGVGMSIAANRYAEGRCVLGFSVEQVRKARMDDDVNALSIGADYFSETAAKDMVKVFLETSFSGEERYRRRLAKMKVLR